MRHLKTYESFIDLFTKKKRENIINRYSILDIREMLAEVFDDTSASIDRISRVYSSNKIIKNAKNVYQLKNTIKNKNRYFAYLNHLANAYYIPVSNFLQTNDIGALSKDDVTYNHLDKILKHKSEIYDFKYFIGDALSDVENFYTIIIY